MSDYYLMVPMTAELFHFSAWRAWDFKPSVGLIIAGGANNQFGVELSTDYGVSFQPLPLLNKAMRYGAHNHTLMGAKIVI